MMKKSMVAYVCSGSNPTAWMAAAPRMQITEPPRYVFTTGTVFPMAFSPSPNTISTRNAGTRLLGTQPVYIQADVSASTPRYSPRGIPRIVRPWSL